jgi:site-specific DNA-methyltransferase (adenine-specific)
MKEIPDGTIRAVVSDPPYGLEFMGHDWDRLDLRGSASRPGTSESAVSRSTRGMNHGIHAGKPAFDLTVDAQKAMQEWHLVWIKEVFRILRSDGIAKIFSATRTFHRLAAAMQQVGFQGIDLVAWTYGSGFPKGLDISRAIDQHLGLERQVVAQGTRKGRCPQPMWWEMEDSVGQTWKVTAPASDEARKYEGYNTALKPSWEPFLVARKP